MLEATVDAFGGDEDVKVEVKVEVEEDINVGVAVVQTCVVVSVINLALSK